MIRVLFVDDENAVLEGLENRLRPLRKRWEMRFALGADEALRLMAERPVDIVVSDMRMPGMDGAQLLDAVRERYPQVARFILSGQTSEDGAMRLMPVAHQILAKPCDAGSLERAIERVCGLQARMEHPGVREAVGMLRNLPALPRLYWDLLREIEKPTSSTGSIAAIIEQDIALTARILQMANSAFFGHSRNIGTVKDALSMLGVLPVRSMIVSLQLCRAMSDICAPRGFSLEALQVHSLRVAQRAMQMLRDSEQRKTAFSAGVLHDLGHLILAVGLPEQCSLVAARADAENKPEHELEAEVLGCTHAEIGAHMLSLWGLPTALVDAVACHHTPGLVGSERLDATTAIHIANALALQETHSAQRADRELDHAHLQRLGLSELVAGWRRGDPIKAQ